VTTALVARQKKALRSIIGIGVSELTNSSREHDNASFNLVIQNHALDLTDFPDLLIVADKAGGSRSDGSSDLDGVGRAETIAGAQFSSPVCNIDRDGNP
jgi:hypothetical protein